MPPRTRSGVPRRRLRPSRAPSLAFVSLAAILASTPLSGQGVPHGDDLTPAIARATENGRPLLLYVLDRY